MTRLNIGLNHLHEHKFEHNSQKCLNPICSCGLDIESTSHFLLHCPTFNDERYTLLSTLHKIDYKLLELTNSSLSQTLLHGNTSDKEKNTLIPNSTIEYILSTCRFSTRPRNHNQNFNILRTKRAFKVKWKSFSIIFIGLLMAKNCLRPESRPLMRHKILQILFQYSMI